MLLALRSVMNSPIRSSQIDADIFRLAFFVIIVTQFSIFSPYFATETWLLCLSQFPILNALR